MTDRTTLALAACAGLDDAELAQRGAQGFKNMITRKRKYAAAARLLAVANQQLAKELAATKAALVQAKAQLTALEQLDAPISDTAQAASMLASIAAKPGAPGASTQG